MNEIALIGVPSSAGARRVGQDGGPESFRRAGIIDSLRRGGLEVCDLGDLTRVLFTADKENPREQNLALVRDTAQRVAEQVSAAAADQRKVIVLGGDCTITLGVLAGLIAQLPNLGLIYLDGDVDLNTPESTSSGIFDGMVMSHITGDGAQSLTHIGPRYPLMSEENVVLFGYNPEAGWMDPPEKKRLEACSMLRYPAAQIRGRVGPAASEALAKLEAQVQHVLIHFDVDVIDHRDFPAADVLHEQGLTFDEAMAALKIFASSSKFAGLVITEFNSNRDQEGRLARRLVESLVTILVAAQPSWADTDTASQP